MRMSNARWPSRGAAVWTLICPLCGLGCDAKETNDYTRGAGKAHDEPDTGPTGGSGDGAAEMCVISAVSDCSGGPVPDGCNTKGDPKLGSISGEVEVAAGTLPGGAFAAIGDLYLMAMPSFDLTSCPADKNPILPAATTVIHCADLRDGAKVPFTIAGVPPRPEAWQIIPYLDVNVSAEPGVVPLDACDILAFPKSVVVATATEVKLTSPIALGVRGSALVSNCKLPACK